MYIIYQTAAEKPVVPEATFYPGEHIRLYYKCFVREIKYVQSFF